MCGRLSSKSQQQVVAKLYHATLRTECAPSYNVAPTNQALIIREGKDHERSADAARFGVTRTPPGRPTFLLINLQSERARLRKDLKERRCIIPADGFYEWEQTGPKEKQPHYFYPPEGLFSLAGSWQETTQGLGFCIFTTTPNELVAPLHHRMPVILGHNAVAQWLAPETDSDTLMSLMEPYPAALMREHRVSKHVNNARNKDAACIVPI
jgi:putative SOS response-associated peptidase YedK